MVRRIRLPLCTLLLCIAVAVGAGGNGPGPGGAGNGGDGPGPGGDGNGGRKNCTDTDNGKKNAIGKDCEMYRENPYSCDHLDDNDFSASVMCCACKHRPDKKEFSETCVDTDRGRVDSYGFSCSDYRREDYPLWHFCGILDTDNFNASEMCCACEGGLDTALSNSTVCPFSASSAESDDGLCSCGPDRECYFWENTVPGCPTSIQERDMEMWSGLDWSSITRNTTHFDPFCGENCWCAKRGSLAPVEPQECSTRFNDTGLDDTSESWMVHSVVQLVISRLDKAGQAVADLYQEWRTQAEYYEIKDDESIFPMLRGWATLFFSAMVANQDVLRSCAATLYDTGEMLNVRGTGCKSKGYSLVTNMLMRSGTIALPLLSTDNCTSLGQVRSCMKRPVWVDFGSSEDVNVAQFNQSDGSWNYGPGTTDFRREEWFDFAINASGNITMLPRWISFLDRDAAVGYGMLLKDPTTEKFFGALRCEFSSSSFGYFFRTLVGAGARLFLTGSDKKLAATSHGKAEELKPGEPRSRLLSANESGDQVVAKVGTWIVDNDFFNSNDFRRLDVPTQGDNEGRIPLPRVRDLKWPEMNLTLRFYTYMHPAGIVTLSYVNPSQCDPGHYMPVNDKNDLKACVRCPEGRYSMLGEVVGNNCSECTHGTYMDLEGSTMCYTCEKGKYQDKSGETACTFCPDNTTSQVESEKLTDCTCKEGYFQPRGIAGKPCEVCPHGGSCPGKEHAPNNKKSHYGLVSESTSRPVFLKCVSTYTSNPCLEGDQGQLYKCQDGYGNISCSRCTTGYWRAGRLCRSCIEDAQRAGIDSQQTFRRLLWLAWVCLIIAFYILRRIVNSKYKTLYIFLSFLQVFGLQGSFSLKWPSEIKVFMRTVQAFNLQVDLFMPSCESEWDFPLKYLLYFCLPWLFLTVDLILMALAVCWEQHKEKKKSHREQQQPQPPQPPPPPPQPQPQPPQQQQQQQQEEAQKIEVSQESSAVIRSVTDTFTHFVKRKRLSEYAYDFLAQSLVNMRLMYLALTGRTLDMLRCTSLREYDLEPILSKDPSLLCHEGLHAWFMPFVGVAIAFYLIGTPLAYMIVLYRGYRENKLYSKEHLKRWGLLYGRFEPDYFFWELVIMLRRLCAVMIKCLLNIRLAAYQESGYIGNYQAALMAITMVLAFAMHFYAHPFSNPWLDFGDAFYLGCTVFSCILGICFSTARTPSEVLWMKRLFFFNVSVAGFITIILVYRDIEVVHPTVCRARQRVTFALGIDALCDAVQRRIERLSQRDATAEVTEEVQGVAYERLTRSPVLLAAFRAAAQHSLEERMTHLGISHTHVDIHVLEGEAAETIRVRCLVHPPHGINRSKVQEILDDHSQATMLEALLEGITEAFRPMTDITTPKSVTL